MHGHSVRVVYLLFSVRDSPVVPGLGRDDVVDEGVGEDDPGVDTPSSAHVDGACAGDTAADEGESCCLVLEFPLLRCNCSKRTRNGVQPTAL